MPNPSLPPPVVLALLLAEHLDVDPYTRKYTVHRVTNVVPAAGFPAEVETLWAFVVLSELSREVELLVRVVTADETDELAAQAVPLAAPDPLAVAEVGALLRAVVFPEPGQYRVQVVVGGEVIAERRLLLVGGGGFDARSSGVVHLTRACFGRQAANDPGCGLRVASFGVADGPQRGVPRSDESRKG